MTHRRRVLYSAAAATATAIALCALAAPAAEAQGLLNTKRISAALAGEAVTEAIRVCAAKNFRVSAVLMDTGGVQQAALRGDGTGPQNLAVAHDKAYTAVTFRTDTHALVERARTGTPPSALAKIPNLLLASGGVVIKVGDEVIGALAVSGAAGGDNDHQCAMAGIAKIRDRLK